MTAQPVRLPTSDFPVSTASDPGAGLTTDSAYDRIGAAALRAGPAGRVGLELEAHLIDLAEPRRRVEWARVNAMLNGLPAPPGGSRVTVEPGGQVELSTPPCVDLTAAVDVLRRDQAALRSGLAELGLGAAGLGIDPVRPARRVNPAARYAAMEAYFAATGNRTPGRLMMCSTASLQVNLEAGERADWAFRVQLAQQLGPLMVAMSACSPLLGGRRTGWRSNRQRVWNALDPGRCGPLRCSADPAADWAAYAMRAPVMLVRGNDHDSAQAVRSAIPFGAWVSGEARLGNRRPDVDDLDYHLTTLFPPVRLRGFLEIRYLDAVPARWWPALAAITTVLLDDPRAADLAAEATAPLANAWTLAARVGMADVRLQRAAMTCLAAAAAAVPPAFKPDVEDFAELVAAGRDPGSELQERAARGGTLAVLEEEARG